MSLHKRFIRVAIFQRSYHSNRTSSKPMKFVWTSLKYKPKGFLKTNMNQSINDFNQMKQQEFLFYQNAAIFNNNQNFINLQNYNLNHYQLMDPNQIMQFYRFINTSAYYSNLTSQVPINTENSEIGHADDQNKRIKLNERFTENNHKYSCSTCNVHSNFFNPTELLEVQFEKQNQAKTHNPIPFTLNSTSLLTIAPILQPQYMHSTSKLVSSDENKINGNKRKLTYNLRSSLISKNSNNREIKIDLDETSSSDSKSQHNNEQTSYNFKRKLMDRYISEDEYPFSLKRNKVEDSCNLESFLEVNKINTNLLKYTEANSTSNLSILIGDNASSIDSNSTSSSSSGSISGICNPNFGLLKKILNNN